MTPRGNLPRGVFFGPMMRRLFCSLLVVAGLAAPAGAEILVVAQGPMKGAYGALGSAAAKGAEAGVAAVNASGGVNGELLAFEAADDNCDAAQAEQLARGLVARDVRLVVGPYCMAAARAAARIYGEAGVVMISPAISDAGFTDLSPLALRLAGRDDAQADLAARRMATDVASGRIAVVSDGSAGATALAARLTAQLGERALGVAIMPGQKDYSAAAKAVGEAAAVYFANVDPGDAGVLVKALKAAGKMARLYGSDSLLDPAYLKAGGEPAMGTLITFPADPMAHPAAQTVVADLKAKGVVAEGPVLPALAAVQVFAVAARAGKANDGAGMAQWLRGAREIATVLGPLAFDAHGDLTPPPFLWYTVSNGGFVRDSQ